jgi:hypothetical protein
MEHDVLPVLSFLQRTKNRLRKIGMKKTSPMRLLDWTGMDADISDIRNSRRRAKIKLNIIIVPITEYELTSTCLRGFQSPKPVILI